ncbi:MAG: FkbM family methyltransferase [Oscillospiraceae bacterium]|nr:FkbM family methyltransferase [Oscillospiraceae bacterium]
MMSDKLVLYGAGRYGVFAALVLSAAGNTPCCFCDKEHQDSIEPITGLPIISLQMLKSDYPDSEIVVTAFRQKIIDEIYADLKATGIDKNRISQFYSLHDAVMQNPELINYISRHGESDSVTLLGSVLRDQLEIQGDVLKLKDLYFPYDKSFPTLFAELGITLLTYLSGLPYTRKNVGMVDCVNISHAYILEDANCPMTINRNDVVIDAGAWYGDFSLLAAKVFGAKVYAFEPSIANHEKLLKTIALNGCGDKIFAIKSGLGSCAAHLRFDNNPVHSDGSKISDKGNELITVTTVDDFVAENKLGCVDFIKSDIEGFEREMIKGAAKTLRELAPKLSLCTYHFPEDPTLLRILIGKANPAYKFEQRQNMLFAWVEKR